MTAPGSLAGVGAKLSLLRRGDRREDGNTIKPAAAMCCQRRPVRHVLELTIGFAPLPQLTQLARQRRTVHVRISLNQGSDGLNRDCPFKLFSQ